MKQDGSDRFLAILRSEPKSAVTNLQILYFIIVREVVISESIAARGLKFWLQVALSAPIATPWTQIRKSGSGSGKSGFSGIFFSLFFASTDLLGPQGHPPDVPVPPNPDPDREIRFFENPDYGVPRKLLQLEV